MSRPGSAGIALWWEAARPRTLPAAIAPVMAASALAWHDGVFHGVAAVVCLSFALLIQIGREQSMRLDCERYEPPVEKADSVPQSRPVSLHPAALLQSDLV